MTCKRSDRLKCCIIGADNLPRRATDDSILAIQIFDQKKFKKKDQGFLGVINVRVGDVIDLQSSEDGESFYFLVHGTNTDSMVDRDAYSRPEEIE